MITGRLVKLAEGMIAGASWPTTVCVLAILGASACASAPAPTSFEHATSALEIANRTPLAVRVTVRGRVEAEVPAGARRVVRALAVGKARVVAEQAGETLDARDLELPGGGTATWVLVPRVGEPLPEPAPLATLVIEDALRGPIVVVLDGVRLGRVFAGETRTFRDVPSGAVLVRAEPDDGTAAVTAHLALSPAEPNRWRVVPAGVPIAVENATAEAVTLSVDGVARERIAAGATWHGREPSGTHVLAAVSEPSRRPYETIVTLAPESDPGAENAPPSRWRLADGEGELVVTNGIGDRLTVTAIAGEAPAEPIILDPGEAHHAKALASGTVAVVAVDRFGLRYEGRVDIAPGHVARWTAMPFLGSLRVVNRTAHDLRFFTRQGAGREADRGTIARGATVVVPNVPRGKLAVRAFDGRDRQRYEDSFDFDVVPAATWTIEPATASLAVANHRHETIDVFVEGRPGAAVEGAATRVIGGLPVGIRTVTFVGRTTGVTSTHKVTLEDGVVTALDASDVIGEIAIANQTGEALVPAGALDGQSGQVAPGASATFKARVGKTRALFIGAATGFRYARDLDVVAGAPSAVWAIRVAPASLAVWSKLAEPVAITIDDRAVGSVNPDQALTIPDIAPGVRRVQSVGLRSGHVQTDTLAFAPDGTRRLTLTMELASLLVENKAAIEVSVTIDGDAYGRVAGGTHGRFGRIPPGRHKVVLHFVGTRRTEEHELDLRDGQAGHVVAESPMGLLVVENAAYTELKLRVDGVFVATIPASGGPVLVPAPAGLRRIELERASDHSVHGFSVHVSADAAVHVAVPTATAPVVVENRLAASVRLRAGDRALGALAAGAAHTYDLPAWGVIELSGRDEAGRTTHSTRLDLRPGEVATWVLSPAPGGVPRD